MTLHWKHLRNAAVLCWAAALLSAFPQAQPRLQEVLDQMDGYQARPLQSAAVLEGVPRQVLDEYIVEESSMWSLREAQSGSELEARIFTMLDPPGAYGLLTYLRQVSQDRFSQRLDMPMRHRFGGRSLALSSGSHFILLQASPSEISPRDLLMPAALEIWRGLDAEDVDSVTVLNLPRQDLEQGSVSHYLGRAGLSADPLLPSSLKNRLGIQRGVEITTARYNNDGSLILVGYPTPSLAREAEARLRASSVPAPFEMKRSGILLALAQGAPSANLLDQVAYKPVVRWVKEKEDQTPGRTFQSEMTIVYGIFSNWAVFTVLFIFVAGGFGGLVGATRYAYYRAHPEKADRTGMICLDLLKR